MRLPFAICLLSALFAAAEAAAETRLVPESAAPGATVSITGKGFGPFRSTQQNRVLFHGVPALVQRWEPDLLVVKVPLKAQSGAVDVFVGKKKVTAASFTVERPAIQAIVPAEVEPGSVIQIVGAHFGNTAGSKDPNTMFGVNDVLIGGATARIRRWRDDKIEAEVPATSASGDVVVRLASSDPLPDGSCCAPVQYAVSNSMPLKILPSIRIDPVSGPVGTKVVLFGKGFGAAPAPGDAVQFNGQTGTVAKWSDVAIVVHVPLGATTGPLTLVQGGAQRQLGTFTVHTPAAIGVAPASGPIGTLLRITGSHFGFFSESGSTPFAFVDFNSGENGVEIGGVPAIVYRWHDDKIDVWVPASVRSGRVVVKRGGTKPKADGTCCAERGVITTEAGDFTVVTPKVDSYEPKSAGLDDVVTIKGSGFGSFLKTAEATKPGVNESGHDYAPIELGQDVARTEVLFNGIAGMVLSWTDTEIQVRVPRRPVFGVGGPTGFTSDVSTGPLVVRRGSWDLKEDGSCCTPKHYVTVEAGPFTILPKGLPHQGYFDPNQPGRD
jgi:hypothetical protein